MNTFMESPQLFLTSESVTEGHPDKLCDQISDAVLAALLAGDQGMMVGFACDETPELMPLTISLAHQLVRRLAEARRSRELPWPRPDGKAQVTVEYHYGRPVRVDTVVVSAQHEPSISHDEIE